MAPVDPSAAILAETEACLAAGKVFQAFEMASAGIEASPGSLGLQVLRALALARTGAVAEAVRQLAPVLDRVLDGQGGAGGVGRLIDVYHEAWRQSGDLDNLGEAARIAWLVAGRDASLWNQGRAASLAWLAQQPERAAALARVVLAAERRQGLSDEAGLLLAAAVAREPAERLEAVARTVAELAGEDYGPVVLLRQLLRELAQHGLRLPDGLWRHLRAPTVIVFTGHDLDRPGQQPPRLTEACLPALEAELRRELDRLEARIGYASPSAGSSLLFVEAMLERGAEINLILPFRQEDFVRHAVAFAGPAWVRRFEQAVARCTSVSHASRGPYLGHAMLFRYGNSMLHGLATLRAGFLGTEPHLLAVWDYEQGSLVGDAADFIDRWGDISRLSIVDLSALPPPEPPAEPAAAPPAEPRVEPERVLRTVMFADIIGFGRLDDSHIPAYFRLLEKLEAELPESRKAEVFNSWGDAFFMVTEEAAELAALALRLRDLVAEHGSRAHGFPADLNVRISLHAGPVYRRQDPFTHRLNFWGFDINRAARLEPVTVAGHVYATQPFVALLTTEESVRASEALQAGERHVSPFICEYVGAVALAKGFGEEAVYHIRERRAAGA